MIFYSPKSKLHFIFQDHPKIKPWKIIKYLVDNKIPFHFTAKSNLTIPVYYNQAVWGFFKENGLDQFYSNEIEQMEFDSKLKYCFIQY